jgi:glycerophosphoryl diester phosphodiesterase
VRGVALLSVALGLGPLALACVAGAGGPAAFTPLVAAHRGGAALWPENSLLAFRNAVALGADYLEFDVHLSRDGEAVVIHDPTLDRTTTGSGPVRDRTLDELRALRLKERSGAVTEERVPTLDEVAALGAAGRRRLLLEIKVDAAGARYPGIEERVLAALDRHGMAASTVVMAFEAETWRRVRALRPDVRAGALYSARGVGGGEGVARAIEDARAGGVGFVGLEERLVDPPAVAQAGAAGILLGVWTVNEPAAMRRLIDEQVGILITDRPDLAIDLLTHRRDP